MSKTVNTFSTASELQSRFNECMPHFRLNPKSRALADDLIDDSKPRKSDTAEMNDITREELGATLSAIEERMDRRVDRMEQSEDRRADAYRREQEARDTMYTERFMAMHKRLEDRDTVIDSKLDTMNSSLIRMTASVNDFEKRLDDKLTEVKSSNRSARWATLAIAAATVVGIWGVNSTIVGSVTGFFDAGQSALSRQQATEKLIQDAKDQSEATYKLLLELKTQDRAREATPRAN
ncbi:hypothetical protein HFD98_25500 [Pseudomonas sp. EKM23D]|uniref:hypothetical protein n=1 Tax=Pseudomonas sp. EKM23D TaxID=2708062 RepID=UPI00142E5CC9|nr:hypothetical protein [Pseudomonas sp. EKM23D]KAF6686940.1 hypothetical protein HFD98_25500 [Pseudomonas sp. EKM23D]